MAIGDTVRECVGVAFIRLSTTLHEPRAFRLRHCHGHIIGRDRLDPGDGSREANDNQ